MKSKHAKSPCCAARIRRFGPRRRQCLLCKRTWTVRPKRRGRPRHRIPVTLLNEALLNKYTLRQLAQRRARVALPTFRYRFRQALHRFVTRPSPKQIPRGPLVLLADGLWFQFEGKPWVLYLTALKPCAGKSAFFLAPLLIAGKEGATRWEQAVAAIPAQARARIRALVVDNLRGMHLVADRRRWVLQLCHFHLILKLQVHRRGPRRALKGGTVREEIYHLIRTALELPEGPRLKSVLGRLHRLAQTSCGTRRMQAVVREFLACIKSYRMYRTHPALGLPTTTNTVESMGGIIRDLFRRSRAASNPRSLLLWATALIRLRPEITCNGKTFNRIN